MAKERGAPLLVQRQEWNSWPEGDQLRYRDSAGELALPLPVLPGPHQFDNAGLALALLRHQQALAFPPAALAQAMTDVRWPARLQKLRTGPLAGSREVWLDGGHNAQAAELLARSILSLTRGRPLHLVAGCLNTKDPQALLSPFRNLAVHVGAIGFDHPLALPANELAAIARGLGFPAAAHASVASAVAAVPEVRPVLIAGSLYLAGEVLALNDELPD
jgi:dihydrofolate synthase/folylpolyglutamate synthase